MRALLWQDAAELSDGARVGTSQVFEQTCACAQAHIPRRRRSMSPLRASGGSASPSAAIPRAEIAFHIENKTRQFLKAGFFHLMDTAG